MTIEEALLIFNITSENPSIIKIKNIYRKLVKIYHPDSSGRKEHQRFVLIQDAYELLKERFKNNTFIEPDEIDENEIEPNQKSEQSYVLSKVRILLSLCNSNSDIQKFSLELGELIYFLKLSENDNQAKKDIIASSNDIVLMCEKALKIYEDISLVNEFINIIKLLIVDKYFSDRFESFNDLIVNKIKVQEILTKINCDDYTNQMKMSLCNWAASYCLKHNDVNNSIKFNRLGKQFQKFVFRP